MLGFAGSMVYSAEVGSKLDENALSIATDASPAIEHLSAARGELLRIQLAAVASVERIAAGGPVDRAPFDDALSRLHHDLAAYGALPFYPDEHRHFLETESLLLAGYVGVSISNYRLYNEAMTAKRAREDLLATVSHDLKNPLNTIRISTHLLRRSTDTGTLDLAERIDRTAERMTRLIGDLLDASKIEAGVLGTAPRPEAAGALVDSAIDLFRLLAGEKSIQLLSQVPSSIHAVVCERDLVLRVFSNLIGNAIKFSPEGTPIVVAAKPVPGEVQFSVSDSGPGIPAGHLPHVFDRYWQEKGGDRRGSGLGLYIAKGIVEAHGGRIWLESAPGRGTTIFFTLPIARRSDDARAP
jgi:signal transduction histidine kinase